MPRVVSPFLSLAVAFSLAAFICLAILLATSTFCYVACRELVECCSWRCSCHHQGRLSDRLPGGVESKSGGLVFQCSGRCPPDSARHDSPLRDAAESVEFNGPLLVFTQCEHMRRRQRRVPAQIGFHLWCKPTQVKITVLTSHHEGGFAVPILCGDLQQSKGRYSCAVRPHRT